MSSWLIDTLKACMPKLRRNLEREMATRLDRALTDRGNTLTVNAPIRVTEKPPTEPAMPPTRTPATVKRIRIVQSTQHPRGRVFDADTGKAIDGAVVGVKLTLKPQRPPTAELTVHVHEADVTVITDNVRWLGLDRVPAEALRAEIARREVAASTTGSGHDQRE